MYKEILMYVHLKQFFVNCCSKRRVIFGKNNFYLVNF